MSKSVFIYAPVEFTLQYVRCVSEFVFNLFCRKDKIVFYYRILVPNSKCEQDLYFLTEIYFK